MIWILANFYLAQYEYEVLEGDSVQGWMRFDHEKKIWIFHSSDDSLILDLVRDPRKSIDELNRRKNEGSDTIRRED